MLLVLKYNFASYSTENLGMKIIIQTSSVKLFDFFNLFWVYRINSVLEKILSMLPPPSARNLDPTKTAFSKFYFPKNEIDVSVTSSCVQKMTKITGTKTRTVICSKGTYTVKGQQLVTFVNVWCWIMENVPRFEKVQPDTNNKGFT